MGKQYFPVTFLSRKKYHFFFLTIIHFCLKQCMHGLRSREKNTNDLTGNIIYLFCI